MSLDRKRTKSANCDEAKTLRTPKDIYTVRKKARFKKKVREKRQRQKERRAGYLTETGRFDELVAEGLPKVYEMKAPPCP
jgi:hypothetical protein